MIVQCSTCKISKNSSEFFKDKRRKNGLYSACKTCHRKFTIKFAEKKGLTWSEYQKEWRKKNPEKFKKTMKQWRENNKEKMKAHSAVSYARVKKILTKSSCEMCNSKESEAHHFDYSKPLKVTWLCHSCHMKMHKILAAWERV